MGEKIPKWESELWSYVNSGDGLHCPLLGDCKIARTRGGCFAEDLELRMRLQEVIEDDSGVQADWEGKAKPPDCRDSGKIFQLIERLARKYLSEAKVYQPPVTTAIFSQFDRKRAVEIRTVPLKSYHAAIWRLRDSWVIQLKSDDTAERKRFTLFHEVFHILAHGGGSPVFRKAGLRGGTFNELMADCFAIYIMLPEKMVREKWVEVKDLARMAEIFEVPKSIMHMRLRYLELI